MRKWSLGHLTVQGALPWELVEIAARAGYDAVDPFVGLIDAPGTPKVPLTAGHANTRRMAQALKANGIACNSPDAFLLEGAIDWNIVEGLIEGCAELGARNINAMIFDEDLPRGVANLAAIDEMAAAVGLPVLLEFMPISRLATAQDALDVIAQIGSGNIGLMVDALHLSQSGGTPADMYDYSASIFGVQLCDAPGGLNDEDYLSAAMGDRFCPGDGELPVRDFMAAVPAGMVCAVEIPLRAEPDLLRRATVTLAACKSVDCR